MSRRYPLQMLIQARQARVDSAQKAVEAARNAQLACEQSLALAVSKKQRKAEAVFEQRNRLIGATAQATTAANDYAQRSFLIDLLTEQLIELLRAEESAKESLRQAQAALAQAIREYRRLQQRLDNLLERKSAWRMQLNVREQYQEEIAAEETFLSIRFNQEQSHAHPSKRH